MMELGDMQEGVSSIFRFSTPSAMISLVCFNVDGPSSYWSDVFLLDRFPCKMVELVGWVAGVDEKEKSQTFYRKPSALQTTSQYPQPS